tara:strand:- start:1924 stop:2067 length:144 start_codon:yes stop_codon:yes gene_type:complete
MFYYYMIDKLSKDDIMTLFTFLGNYIDDKDKLIQIIEGLEEIFIINE